MTEATITQGSMTEGPAASFTTPVANLDATPSGPEGRPTLLILGASGDLTKRLLLPGLGTLLEAEPERRVRVVGADRAALDTQDWVARLRDSLLAAEVPAEVIEELTGDTAYHQVDVLQLDQLSRLLGEVQSPLVIYFALPPQVSVQVCGLLEQHGVTPGTRLALEKPFGIDLATAQTLNVQLLKVVPEDHIHRIDHFLGVNTVLNLLGVRFANRLLQPLWSAEHIEAVNIVYDESLALEGRAGYYDKAGAMRDMIQSHLLQVLGFFAMEPPAAIEAEEVRSLVAQVMRSTSVWGDDAVSASWRARYTAGTINGRQIPNYVDEDGVDGGRNIETLAEVVLQIANARWTGVPFRLRSGKALGVARKHVEVIFKDPSHVPTGLKGSGSPDRLVLDLKPGAVILDLTMNAEGDPFELEQKELSAVLGAPRMLPYGEVLGSIFDGNPLLTIRGDVAEQQWRMLTPVISAWQEDEVPMQEYAAGSSGPPGWGVVPGPGRVNA